MQGGPEPSSQRLPSQFEHDPDMAELVRMFVDELPQRLQRMSAAWHEHNMRDLATVAHQLRGSSAGYGFPTIGSAAGRLEDSIRSANAAAGEAALESVRREMDELSALVRRAMIS